MGRFAFAVCSSFVEMRVNNSHTIHHMGVYKETDVDAISDEQQQQEVPYYLMCDPFQQLFVLNLNN